MLTDTNYDKTRLPLAKLILDQTRRLDLPSLLPLAPTIEYYAYRTFIGDRLNSIRSIGVSILQSLLVTGAHWTKLHPDCEPSQLVKKFFDEHNVSYSKRLKYHDMFKGIVYVLF